MFWEKINKFLNENENLRKYQRILEKIMEKLIDRLKEKLPDAVGNIQYKGVEEYGDSNLVLKLTVNVKPLKQYKTESIVLREAKLLFDEEGVKIK